MKLMSAVLLGVLFPTIAAAQNSKVFIQAGPVLDALFASDYDGLVAATISLSPLGGLTSNDEQVKSTRERLALGGSFAVGVFVAPSLSLRAETSVQGSHVATDEMSSASERTSSSIRNTSRATDISVAAAWHQGADRRIGISYLAGLVFRRETNETFSSYTYPTLAVIGPGGRPTQVIQAETEETSFQSVVYDRGIMAGIDVSARISDHLAIVPQIRLVSAGYSWNLRPGVAVYWRP